VLNSNDKYTGCVSESGDFATLFLVVRQHWGGCRYAILLLTFKGFQLQWSCGLEHKVLLL
jgi:hypothetical protein